MTNKIEFKNSHRPGFSLENFKCVMKLETITEKKEFPLKKKNNFLSQ